MATRRSLPSNIQRLLEGPIDSFEKLELVLALYHATKRLTVSDLAQLLKADLEEVQRMIDDLASSRLLTIETSQASKEQHAEKQILLAPAETGDGALEDLVKLYDEDRVLVVTAFSAVAMDKIRGMAARTFADAFRLHKKKDNDDG